MRGAPRIGLVARVAAVALLLQLGSVTAPGCGPTGAGVEYRESQAFEYERPAPQVWLELVALLKDKSFALAESAPEEHRTLETPWVTSGTSRSAYQVRMTRIDARRYTIHLWLKTEADLDGDGTFEPVGEPIRAWDAEWELVQRAEPFRASKIREEAARTQARTDRDTESCYAGCRACATCANAVDRHLE